MKHQAVHFAFKEYSVSILCLHNTLSKIVPDKLRVYQLKYMKNVFTNSKKKNILLSHLKNGDILQ